MEKNSDEQIWDFLKRNLFSVKKLILGLDDCVDKKVFDDLQKNFDVVQVEIKRLTNHKKRLENEVDNKTSEIISLRREQSGLQNKIDRLEDELQRSDNNLKSARREISTLNAALAEKISEIETYQKNYSDLEQSYQAYKKLPDDIKFGLQGIFGAGDNPTVFLAGALQNLDALFDYVANAINQGVADFNIEILRGIFQFAFAAQNKIHREEIFAPLNVNTGEDFNSSTMRKISSSCQSGVVKEIFLRGYKYRASGNIIRKTLVEIA